MILVTGANGLLGSYICRKLLSEDLPFMALKRPHSDLSLLEEVKDDIQWIVGDLDDLETLEDKIKGIKTVIHSAALMSFHSADRSKMTKVNVLGTRNLVNLCLRAGIPELIYISSVAALGRPKNIREIDENTKWQPSGLNSAYGESKYFAELEVWRGQAEGLKTTVVNPSVILGPGDWEKSSAKIFKYVWDERPAYASGKINYVDVRDVADIVVDLHKGDLHGERFIINAGNANYKDVFNIIAKHFNKKPPGIKVSPWMMAPAVSAAKVISWLKREKPALTIESARLSQSDFYFKNDKIIHRLAFQFRSLEDTLRWCCNELKLKYVKCN